jgi:hypothetical protein
MRQAQCLRLLPTLLVAAVLTPAALPARAAAASLITSFSAGVLVDENTANPKEADYATQAGSHPDVAFTKFSLNTTLGSAEAVRVDLPPGLSVNSEAVPQCSQSGTNLTSCPSDTQVGTATVTITKIPLAGTETLTGAVYNMVAPKGAPGDYAFQVSVLGLVAIRTDLIGGVRYYPSNGRAGDYGEYFTISAISNLLGAALEKSELKFWGAPEEHNGGGAPNNAFLTNPTACSGPQTTYMSASTYAPVASGATSFTTPVGTSGCGSVPFAPTVSVTPNTTKRDTPDGIALDLHVPQDETPSKIATANLKQAVLTLPEGMSLDPSAANGLQACTDTQFGQDTNAAVTCPAASIVGSAEILTPVLPAALKGSIYVGQPQAGNRYRIFVNAENAASGVVIRLKGSVAANADTGQLTATFEDEPQLPFSDLKLNFNTGQSALFANPLQCGAAATSAGLTPYSAETASTAASAFTVDGNGSGGACVNPTPFAAATSASLTSTVAGAGTNLSFSLTREDGEQTLGALTATLPAGLLADLSNVTLCLQPEAAAGTCTEASRIGTVAVSAGAGSNPLPLAGTVYLTGPYGGDPFGLSIVVPAIAGPYNLGTVVVRAKVDLNTVTGVLTIATDPLPTIVEGIPLRLKALTVDIDRSGLLENPTSCQASAIAGSLSSTAAQTQPFSNPVQFTGCEALAFAPTLSIVPTSVQRDASTGLEASIGLPANSSDLRGATVQLPAGLSLNPAFANGLQACTDAQLAQGSESPVGCPQASVVGTVEIQTPLLPTRLSGSVYIGQPLSSEPESGEEYRLFLDAENSTYGLSVRLIGLVKANTATGQLTVSFPDAPPIPFTTLKLDLAGAASTPLSNSAECGRAPFLGTLTSTSEATATAEAAYTVGEGAEATPCQSPAPFDLTQSTLSQPNAAAANSSFTLALARADGQQYLSSVKTTLPAGLIGRIASVTPCTQASANAGACSAASQIGTAEIAAGTGAAPLELPGSVYLTEGYGGAPFGLSIAIPAESVGPFDFGTVVARAKVEIDAHTARVTVTTDALPTILGGVPLRLRALTVDLQRPGFMLNPTSCAAAATESLLTSTLGVTQAISTPLEVSACGSLPFAPSLTASASTHSKQGGAGLDVELVAAGEHQANIASVTTTLPLQLPARLNTLQKACAESVFLAGPANCPRESLVGHAAVSTPVLADPFTGPAYLVADGGAGFPDLDLVLAGDGVRLTLAGNTTIKRGAITATFPSVPDVPMSHFSLLLPEGPYSVLSANGDLCSETLTMPTTITAHNGSRLTQQTVISVPGCSPRAAAGAAPSRLKIAPSRFAAASNGASVTAKIAKTKKRRRGKAHVKHTRKPRTGTTVTYTDAQAGTVTFAVLRSSRGEMRSKQCVKRVAHRHRRGRSCLRYISMGAFTYAGHAGANSFHFSGRVHGHELPVGAYTLSVATSLSGAVQGAKLTARFYLKRA